MHPLKATSLSILLFLSETALCGGPLQPRNPWIAARSRYVNGKTGSGYSCVFGDCLFGYSCCRDLDGGCCGTGFDCVTDSFGNGGCCPTYANGQCTGWVNTFDVLKYPATGTTADTASPVGDTDISSLGSKAASLGSDAGDFVDSYLNGIGLGGKGAASATGMYAALGSGVADMAKGFMSKIGQPLQASVAESTATAPAGASPMGAKPTVATVSQTSDGGAARPAAGSSSSAAARSTGSSAPAVGNSGSRMFGGSAAMLLLPICVALLL